MIRFFFARVILFAMSSVPALAQVQVTLDGQSLPADSGISSIELRTVDQQRRLEVKTFSDDLRCMINPDFDPAQGDPVPSAEPKSGDLVLAIDQLPGDLMGEYGIDPDQGVIQQLLSAQPVLEVVTDSIRIAACDPQGDCPVLECAPGGTPVFSADFETPPPPQVDLVAGGQSGPQAVAGSGPDNVALALTLANPAGTDSATNVVAMIDETGIPAIVTGGDPVPTPGTFSASTGEWSIAELQVGTTATLDYLLTAPKDTPDGAQVCVALTGFTAVEDIINPDDDTSQACVGVVRQIDLEVVVSNPTEPVTAGDSIAYSVQLQNLGPSVASGVALQVDLTLPTGAVLSSSIAAAGSFDEGSGLWTLGAVDVSESPVPALTIQIDTAGMTADGTVQVDAAVSAGNETDPVTTNDSASDTTQVTVTP